METALLLKGEKVLSVDRNKLLLFQPMENIEFICYSGKPYLN